MISIRSAVREDAAAIARVHIASWRVAYGDFMGARQNAWISRKRKELWERELIGEAEVPVLVAEADGEIVGVIGWGSPGDGLDEEAVAQIYVLFVHPDRFRCGVGTALLEAMESKMDKKAITAWAIVQCELGHVFYLNKGFEREPATEKMFRLIDTDYPIVRYRKPRR